MSLSTAALAGFLCSPILAAQFFGGVVLDENGQGVRAASVTLTAPGGIYYGVMSESMNSSTRGRFGFSSSRSKGAALSIEASGFESVRIPLPRNRRDDLRITLKKSSGSPQSPERLPSSLKARIEKDTKFEACQEAHSDPDSEFDERVDSVYDTFRIKMLSVTKNSAAVILISGIGPCLAGANNGDDVIYAKFGSRWRRVLRSFGQSLEVLPTQTNGWNDIQISRHGSATSHQQIRYGFSGGRYVRTGCQMEESYDIESGAILKRPRRARCQ
jgi:hypothetical protein